MLRKNGPYLYNTNGTTQSARQRKPTSDEPQPTGYLWIAKLSYIAFPNKGNAQANPDLHKLLPANTDAIYLGYDIAKYEYID